MPNFPHSRKAGDLPFTICFFLDAINNVSLSFHALSAPFAAWQGFERRGASKRPLSRPAQPSCYPLILRNINSGLQEPLIPVVGNDYNNRLAMLADKTGMIFFRNIRQNL
jgi:hypothetical protein